MKKTLKWITRLGLGLLLLLLVACDASAGSSDTVTIGVIGEDNDVWDFVAEKLESEEGITIELVRFTDYAQPNNALAQEEIDLNAFQHKLFLESFNADSGTTLVPIGDTVISPLGIYSDTLTDVNELKEDATVAIPNDLTNGGRALLLLQTAGFISVYPDAGVTPTVKDITNNPLNLDIQELDASQTARALQDVDISIINSGMAVDAGFVPTEDSIFLEPVNDQSEPYVNIIVSREVDTNNEVFQKVVEAYQSEDTKEIIAETSKGSSIPAWD
ncbi:MetQ/NlpA family ABC transporter substrate-binding protein [Alkalibacterium sp. 20]|uniref:MetQ/NlpA family ABC transporter substrate-binding protein n=1 Tax=Alkalibacterium sp. 20 TaxID=1798803 RepID=UPI0009001F98|nr:MetQ/NlpA family ABC transporter substrate-binding protein [Alkalibacterium sp. 20]OJF97094.1 metal ABC transporter substrate-binding protein [Alkalibacterium sp. 20]